MFAGLPLGEAKRLNYYFHFRPIPVDNDENKKVPCAHVLGEYILYNHHNKISGYY